MKKLLGLSLLAVLLLLSNCTPAVKQLPASTSGPSTSQINTSANKPAWENEWERLMVGAKKEGKVVIYTAGGTSIFVPFRQPLEEKFGLKMEVVSGRSVEIMEKLMTERRAGLYLVDLYIGGTTDHYLSLKPANAMEKLEPVLLLPEVTNPKLWLGGELRWSDKDHYVLTFIAWAQNILTLNINYIKREEMQSYRDLLNPRLKGKIVIDDPTIPGIGGKQIAVLGTELMSWDFVRELAKQEPTVTRDARFLGEGLARGKYYTAIGAKPEIVTEFLKADVPLEYVIPKEGTYVSSGTGAISLLTKAPHPNAAKVFTNWLLTKEGQTAFVQVYGVPSGRVDVSTEGLPTTVIPKPDVKYFRGDLEEFILLQPEQYKIVREIFALGK